MNSQIVYIRGMDRSALRKRNKLIFGLSAALLWVIALFLPAYSDGTPGIACFLFGWTMLFDGHTLAFLAWLGNLPFCVAFFMFLIAQMQSRIKASAIIGSFGFLFSFGAFTITDIANGETGVVSEAHATTGTFVWIISLLLVCVGGLLNRRNAIDN